MADRFQSLDNTAPVLQSLKNKKIDVPRSKFDFSRTWYGNAWFGALIPIDLIKTVPGEDYNINYDIMIETSNPLSKKLLNGWRAYVHTYYMNCNDLWEGSENYFDKGRSGNLNLKKPTLAGFPSGANSASDIDCPLFSLGDFLGLPCNSYHYSDSDTSFTSFLNANNPLKLSSSISKLNKDSVDALPFAMYQSIYLDYYAPSNLLQNNKYLYPDNVRKRILSYSSNYVNFFYYDQTEAYSSRINALQSTAPQIFFGPSGQYYIPSDNSGALSLNAIRYRQWKGDIFNTALPFPNLLRGDVPSITLNDVVASIDFSDSLGDIEYLSDTVKPSSFPLAVHRSDSDSDYYNVSEGIFTTLPNGDILPKNEQSAQVLLSSLNKAKITASNIAKINLNQLRALEVYTLFAERMARTDGSYNEMIKAQFGSSPNVHEYRAKYVGGFYQDIYTSDVTAQSSSSSLPLGSVASKGLSVHSGNIGHVFSKDYGYIMTLLSIVPDCTYVNNLDRFWTEISQDTEYFPLLNNLSPQMILNQEVIYSGSQDVLKDGFGWTERFSTYKSRQNKACGLVGFVGDTDVLPSSFYEFANRLQRRIIPRDSEGKPNLNNEFVSMSPGSIDMSVFSVPSMVPFVVTAHSRVSKVSPMPYITQPEGLSPRA